MTNARKVRTPRVYEKKKLFKAFCREQVKQGKSPQADGQWRQADSGKTADKHLRAGYHLA